MMSDADSNEHNMLKYAKELKSLTVEDELDLESKVSGSVNVLRIYP